MNGHDFLNSKWCKAAAAADGQSQIGKQYRRWSKYATSKPLLERCRQIFQFFTHPDVAASDKILLGGALLYCLTPIDLLPDFLPVIGWLDDIGVASMALTFIFERMDNLDADAVLDAEISFPHMPGASFNDEPQSATIDPSGLNNVRAELHRKLNLLRKATAQLPDPHLFDKEIEVLDIPEQTCFRIAVTGRYSSGKSTLLNALLAAHLLPTGPTPRTKNVTYLCHGPDHGCFEELADGTVVHRSTPMEALGGPLALTIPSIPENIIWIDTPGVEDPDRTMLEHTLKVVAEADVLVLVLDAKYLENGREFEFLHNLFQRDKRRKIFTILNKTDALTAEEKEYAIEFVRRELLRCGTTEPRIYAFSAKEELGNAISGRAHGEVFSNFLMELHAFLHNSGQGETLRRKNLAADHLAESIGAMCTSIAAGVEEKTADKVRRLQLLVEKKQKVEQLYRMREEELLRTLRREERRFYGELNHFILSLKERVRNQVAQLSLEELQNSDLIGNFLTEECTAFTEQCFQSVNDALLRDLRAAGEELHMEITRADFHIAGRNVHSAVAQTLPTVLLPSVLIGAWFYCSISSFLVISIAAIAGRERMKTLLSKLLTQTKLSVVRRELLKEIDRGLDEFHYKFDDHAAHLFNELDDRLAHILAHTVEPLHAEEQLANTCMASPESAASLMAVSRLLRQIPGGSEHV